MHDIRCTKLFCLLFHTSSGFNLHKARANELLHCLPGSGTGEDGGLPACTLRGPLPCTTQTRAPVILLAPAYASPPSRAPGPPRSICRHRVSTDPLSTRPVHQAAALSAGPALLPKFCTGSDKVTLLAPPAAFRSVVALHGMGQGGAGQSGAVRL